MGGFLSMLFSPSDKYDIAKIKIGDTKARVREVFGRPEHITSFGRGEAEEWSYTVPFRIYASIDFGADGRVCSRYRSGPA